MDIKWNNMPANVVSPVPPGGHQRSVCKMLAGFLAFVIGVTLLLSGAVSLTNSLSSSLSRRWLEDSFQEDYQNTSSFRSYISGRLTDFLSMGAGGPVYFSDYLYDGYDVSYYEALQEGLGVTYSGIATVENYGQFTAAQRQADQARWEKQAQAFHEQLSKDKNLLYRVVADGEVLYTNADDSLTTAAPAGYNFWLCFEHGRVTILKDGRPIDIYGDGYYTEDSDWYLPGYYNFTVDDSVDQVVVFLAAIAQPQIFIQGSYGDSGGSQQYNQLYSIQQELHYTQRRFFSALAQLGAGLVLLLLSIPLRRDRKQANQALARVTGKVWFEIKLLLFLALLLLFWPQTEYAAVTQELIYSYEGSGLSMAAVLADNGGWLLREYLSALTERPFRLAILFWAFWLLIFNDWRYNKKPWRHGIFAALGARELKYPLQKRLSRRNGAFGLALVLLEAELIALLVLLTVQGDILPYWAIWNLLLLPLLLAAAIYVWFSWRQRQLWTDFGTLSGQLAALRAGTMDGELTLPEDADLYQMADDLNHIRQGLHQAVEERTRSEKMKVELVTNVSHDLKTPLTSIISYTELLSQEPLEPPASEYVAILAQKAERLRTMVQDVFEVSKAASGQLPVDLERLDLAKLLRQTLADMAEPIEASGLSFRTAIPEEEVPIHADGARLYRVFQNLIQNALNYSLPGSRVYLDLVCQGDTAAARIKNTSAAELHPGTDYTGRFVRGDESRTDGGSGLGLSIASSFTQACGGSLTVETNADLFTVTATFPLA